jgi:pilus assembly protein CpaB
MNRRNRTLIVIGLAVLLASAATFLVYRAVQSIPVREVTVVERQQVVATQRVPSGASLQAEQVTLVPWPEANPIPGGFTSVDEVIGRGVTSALLPNEPVTENKLASREGGGGLPPLIPEGMRAISMRVNDIVGVAGFVQPKTRVDVIVTVSSGGAASEPVSRIVLENVEVVAANQYLDTEANREGEARPISVVTVLVTPENSEKLALAQAQGTIILALRNPLDAVSVETRGARMSALLAPPGPPAVRTVSTSGRPRMITPPPPPAPEPYRIEMITGSDRKTTEVKTGRGGGSAGAGS